jgi:hypothetical protein
MMGEKKDLHVYSRYLRDWERIKIATQDAPRYQKKKKEDEKKFWTVKIGQFMQHAEIAIDGPTGVGKTTISSSLFGRSKVKINDFIPDCTRGSRYNIDPIKSLEYIMTFLTIGIAEGNYCWDRCIYSNLIFYFVHQLMCAFERESKDIPDVYEDILSDLVHLASSISLSEILTWFESERSIPTLIIVDSDLLRVSDNMYERSDKIHDAFNSKEHSYLMAQKHAYRFFAECLQFPIIDLANLMEFHTMEEVRILIKMHLRKDDHHDGKIYKQEVGTLQKLAEMLDECNVSALHQFSVK